MKLFKLNNKGLSLVELVCAIGILAMIGVGVAGFLAVSTRSFARNGGEINVQQEAQYATGIIENIIQDSTEAPVAIVDASGVTIGFSVKVQEDQYDVFIDRTDRVLKLTYTVSGGTPVTEIIATDINDFSYSCSGKKIDLNMKFDKGDRHYQTNNAASSRNGDTSTVGSDGSAIIRTAEEIVLEPNQEYDFSNPSITTVIGVPDPTVSVSLRTAGSDTNTQIIGKKLKIGKDETKSELLVDISTNARKADGTVAGKTTVKVYIRRVTGITVTGELVSGEALKANAKYKVTASLTGINLDKKVMLSSDTDYELYHPYNYDFVYQFFDQGTLVDYHDFADINAPVIPAIILSGEVATLDFTLKRDMPTFGAFTVTSGALHPDGRDDTLGKNYNKSHEKYVDTRITGLYSISNHMYHYNAGSIERSTEQQQSEFTYRQNLLNYYTDKSKDPAHPEIPNREYMSAMEWRYRLVIGINEETGARIYAEWSPWMENRGDADDSYAINLRKEATGIFEPALMYELQIKLMVKDKATRVVVWPEATTPTDQYLIEDTVEPVSLFMQCNGSNSTTLFTREVKYGSESAPMTFSNNIDYTLGWSDTSLGKQYVGIDTNTNINNGLKYVIQKKTPTGWETKFSRVSGGQPLRVECRVGTNNAEQSDKFVLKESGVYRILLEGDHIKTYRYDASKANVDERYILQERDLQFWNEGTGQGIYYFQVN